MSSIQRADLIRPIPKRKADEAIKEPNPKSRRIEASVQSAFATTKGKNKRKREEEKEDTFPSKIQRLNPSRSAPPILENLTLRLRDTLKSGYLKSRSKQGVGAPLQKADGKLCKGASSTARSTSNDYMLALTISPDKKRNPAGLVVSAGRNIAILKKMQQQGSHIPKLFSEMELPPERQYTLFMEHLGPDLSSPPNKYDLDEIEEIGKSLLHALRDMHKQQILHGDLKPLNCTRKGVFDFGLSAEINNPNEEEVFIPGIRYTWPYRPPEIPLYHETNFKGDLWALGCTLFELATGKMLIPLQNRTESTPQQDDLDLLCLIQQRLGIKLNLKAREDFYENGNLKAPLSQDIDPPLPHLLAELAPLKGPKADAFVDLLINLLAPAPHLRFGAEEALKHPFFTGPESRDISFKISLLGNPNLCIRILNGEQKVLETIDLRNWRSASCYHIPKSEKPYRFEFFSPENKDQIVHTYEVEINEEGKTIPIDISQIPIRGSRSLF